MNRTAQLLMSAVFCAGVFAQTTTTPPAINQLAYEATLPFSQIGITGNVNLPTNLLSAITGGALEVRQTVELTSGGTRLRIRHILVPPGSPNPTPAGMQTATIEDFVMRIDTTSRTTDPGTITFIGVIDLLNAASPIAERAGRPIIASFGYTSATPRSFGNMVLLIPGRASTFIQSGTGTLTFAGEAGPTDPGTGENRPPVASVGPSARITTSQSEILLDASGSTDPDTGDTLTYSWRVVRGAANLLTPKMAQTRVQLAGNADEYIFELTVTDSKGASSTATLNVFYTGRF